VVELRRQHANDRDPKANCRCRRAWDALILNHVKFLGIHWFTRLGLGRIEVAKGSSYGTTSKTDRFIEPFQKRDVITIG